MCIYIVQIRRKYSAYAEVTAYRVVGRWNSLDQEMVDARKYQLDKDKQGWAFSWNNPLSPRPHGMICSPVKPHKVWFFHVHKNYSTTATKTAKPIG